MNDTNRPYPDPDPNEREETQAEPPVIDLSRAPNARSAWDRSRFTIVAWSIVQSVVVYNPGQLSSRLRVLALRAFGARIGRGVIFRPRTRIHFPWNLTIGENSWIGEGVWIHNQDKVMIGANVVISQETFITTGSHAHRRDMALITRPIAIGDGAWITTRCIVLGGTVVGRSALATPLTLVKGIIPPNAVVSGPECAINGHRFPAT